MRLSIGIDIGSDTLGLNFDVADFVPYNIFLYFHIHNFIFNGILDIYWSCYLNVYNVKTIVLFRFIQPASVFLSIFSFFFIDKKMYRGITAALPLNWFCEQKFCNLTHSNSNLAWYCQEDSIFEIRTWNSPIPKLVHRCSSY